ncbi:multidrug ABC transporter ATP-binding protein, partial [Pantoea allii]
LLVVGLIRAVIELAQFSNLSRIIDLVNHSTPATLFRDNWETLLWMGCVALILRAVFIALHEMLVHQSINPGMTSMIR